ncbi:putative ribonuclease H protein [Cardamine amara subsp. amara]|uniref:Ribonuclease H protein n=1 Tax=Cardamine amara subsp. amara TaxID=228776 RepID=A0ABD0ZKG3_CARAN
MLAFTKMARFQGLLQTRATILLIRNYHKQHVEVVWKKPKIGWTKLNFDGSRGREGQASIGGIFRNHKAEFLLGYSESIGEATSTMAEFAALKRGLELVLENGWTNLWLEGDAKIIVDIIAKRGRLRCEETIKHVNYINVVMPGLSNCVLSHVYREGNRAADKLAKLGHQFQDPKVWRVQPPDIVLPIMHDDARGKIILRTK